MSLEQPPTLYVPPTSAMVDVARKVNEWGGSLAHWLRSLQANSSLDSVLLKDIALASLANTTVNHKLGRVPQEYLITKINGASTIYLVSWDAKQAILSSTGAVTVNLRFS